MSGTPDIVSRITQNINAFQYSKVKITGPTENVTPAARVGDIIHHTSFWSALAGAFIGAAVTVLAGVAVAAGVAAICTLTGGTAAPFLLGAIKFLVPLGIGITGGTEAITEKATKFIDEVVGGDPSGPIILGSIDVFVNGKPLAMVDKALSVECTRHSPPQKIAQGSKTVSVNNKAVARKGDKTECSATIAEGSPNVFIGSEQETYVEMKSEFNGWQRALLFAVEFLVPPTALFHKGIGKAFIKGVKSLATKGARVGAAIATSVKKAFSKVKKFFQRKPKFDPATATNLQKGNFGEIKAAQNMEIPRTSADGKQYNLERIGRPPPSSLDEPIKKGIDGIYRNNTPPPKFVIDEAKYDTSELKKLKDGTKQMSDDWVMGGGRLDHLDPKTKKELMESIQNNEIDKVLSKVDSHGNVQTFKLDEFGKNVGKWP